MTGQELAVLWTAFDQVHADQDHSIRIYETNIRVLNGGVLLGVDTAGLRHLLIPTDPHRVVAEDTSGTTIRVLQRTLSDQASIRRFADITCLRPDLYELFDLLLADILTALSPEADPLATCRNVLERWRELLAQRAAKVIDSQLITGLFGELLYLLRILRINPNALDVWRGPEKARHDFAFEGFALEIKTSLSRIGRFCEIHGPEQLSPPMKGELFLAYVRLEETPLGNTVQDLVDEVLTTGVPRKDFVSALNKYGYSSESDNPPRRFRTVEDRVYQVGPGFPRIEPSSFKSDKVPNGIIDLTYTIDLSSEPPSPLPAAEVNALIRGFAGATHV